MQRIIREVSEKRQAAIDFALGPALVAAIISIYISTLFLKFKTRKESVLGIARCLLRMTLYF